MRIQKRLTVGMLGLLLATSGCGSDGKNGKNALVRIDAEPAGANCAAGGLAVRTGLDADGDGLLSDEEVMDTRYVCNGQGIGTNSLVSITDEPVGGQCGDAAGKRIDSGLDLDGNGQLDPGEITSTAYVCNGTGEGINSMVNLSDEPPGGHCGDVAGVRIDSGLDTNHNGQLDPGEITATSYVCNGADGEDGLNTLVRTEPETPGANCTHGGLALERGLDINRDGILQPSEIENTSYVCNGAPGTPGQDGKRALVRQEDEPAGSNCPFGGRAILSGLDEDGNGYLDNTEVTSMGYACNGAPGTPGHATVFSSTDEPAGTHCSHGGWRMESGLDINDNGILDPAEASAVQYVCHGAASLVNVQWLPANTECGPATGWRIETGVDRNGNGALDADEITTSQPVCDGINGQTSLVRTETEPAGTNCTLGGVRIESGLDANGDGTLSPGEVSQVSYACSGGSEPTLVNASNADWGGVCPQGGLKLETGLDGNGNGILDPAEVLRTQYVCNLYFVQITGSDSSTCGLLSNGTVRCWGYNGYGQLGIGSTLQKLVPTPVLGLSNVTQVSGGGMHFCALLADGTVRCWGYNNYGQLGDGSTSNRYTPVPVAGLSGAVQIDAGYNHTCARLASGQVACWGYNNYGQLGDGSNLQRITPVTVLGLANAAQITAGFYHTCARLTTNAAKCWGYNNYGQLGDGSMTNRNAPADVFGLNTITQISAGYYHTCAALSNGVASCWGYNAYGQLGDGTTTNRNTPGPVSGLTGVASVATSVYSSCALLSNGTARCWGYNNYGQLGDGTTTNRSTPVPVLELANATHIADTLGYYSCAGRTDNLPMCWGYNISGQLGDGTTTNRSVPTFILWNNSL